MRRSSKLGAERGETYFVRVGEIADADGGPDEYNLLINYDYDLDSRVAVSSAPVALTVDSRNALQSETLLARLEPLENADLLVLEISGGTDVTVLGGGGTQHFTSSPTEPMRVTVDVRGQVGPFDVLVGRDGNGTPVSVEAAALTMPETITNDDVTSLRNDFNPATGDYVKSLPSPNFGEYIGVTWENIRNDDGEYADLTLSRSDETLLALYKRSGNNELSFEHFVIPSSSGETELRTLLQNDEQYAMLAFPLSFDSSLDDIDFTIDGPRPDGIGLASAFEPQTSPHDTWKFHLREGSFDHDADQQMWRTIVPSNIQDRPTLKIAKSGLSALDGRVRIYENDGSTDYPLVGEFDFDHEGQIGASVEQLRGKQLLIVAEPFREKLGAGNYEIEITAPVTDPSAYWFDENDHLLLPIQNIPGAVTDIVQNQLGDGVAMVQQGFQQVLPEFTGGGPVERDYYRFWAPDGGPVTVRTVSVPGSSANTTIQVYRLLNEAGGLTALHVGTGNQAEYVQANRDWFPSDRSEIDAQIVINNLPLLEYNGALDQYGTGGGWYIVAVQNEEGSGGQYQLEVDAPDFQPLGQTGPTFGAATMGSRTYLSEETGGALVAAPYIADIRDFVGYFPVQIPDDHDGTLTINPDDANLQFDVALADGTILPRPLIANAPVVIPDDAQSVFVRVQAVGDVSAFNGLLGVSTNLVGHDALPLGQPSTPVPQPLTSTPRGESLGTMSDFISGSTASPTAAYQFTARSGPLALRVSPDSSTAHFDWAVYVDGTRRAIQEYRGHLAQTLTELSLPGLNGEAHDVVVLIDPIGHNFGFDLDVARSVERLDDRMLDPDGV